MWNVAIWGGPREYGQRRHYHPLGCSGVGTGTWGTDPTLGVFGRGREQPHLAEGSPSLSVSAGPAGPLFPAPKAVVLPFALPQSPTLGEELGGRKCLFFQAVSGLVCWGRKRYPTNSPDAEGRGGKAIFNVFPRACPESLAALSRELPSRGLETKAPSFPSLPQQEVVPGPNHFTDFTWFLW